MRKKVAIFQTTVTGGGRIRVVNDIIKILNESGIVPDIYTYRVNPSFKPEPSLTFKISKLFCYSRGLDELKMPLLNLQMRKLAKAYDVLINSNNSLLFVPTQTMTIAYIHFPREMRILSNYQSLAFPDGKTISQAHMFYRFYRNFSRYLYSFRSVPKNHIILANSQFTKNMLGKAYSGIEENDITVVYPPVAIDYWQGKENLSRKETVTTLARFSDDKRQLEQIQIAEQVPGLYFNVVGFIGNAASQKYYDRCQQYIKEKQLKNVALHPNLAIDQAKHLLQQSKFFMHNLRNEPFGISTVEAIAAGCIPVVHNSGGQREIVPFEDLRFDDKDEAIQKLNRLQKTNLESLAITLKNHVRQYDTSSFYQQMKNLLLRALAMP